MSEAPSVQNRSLAVGNAIGDAKLKADGKAGEIEGEVRNASPTLTLEGKSGVAAACYAPRSWTRAWPARVFNFAQTPGATPV
jgi:hypothetical protein